LEKRVNYKEVLEKTVEAIENELVLLVSVDKNGKANPMAIGWAVLGELWGKDVFVVFVRKSRYTYSLIEQSGDFTVNVFDKGMKKVVIYCGQVSGREHDKFKEKNLTTEKSTFVKSPLIKESKIKFECKVIGKTDILPEFLDEEIKNKFYSDNDYHRVYFGEILAVYI